MQNYRLDTLDASLLARWAYTSGKDQLFDWPGLRQRRAETLPYSGLLLERLIQRLEPRFIEISLTGLRFHLISLADRLHHRTMRLHSILPDA